MKLVLSSLSFFAVATAQFHAAAPAAFYNAQPIRGTAVVHTAPVYGAPAPRAYVAPARAYVAPAPAAPAPEAKSTSWQDYHDKRFDINQGRLITNQGRKYLAGALVDVTVELGQDISPFPGFGAAQYTDSYMDYVRHYDRAINRELSKPGPIDHDNLELLELNREYSRNRALSYAAPLMTNLPNKWADYTWHASERGERAIADLQLDMAIKAYNEGGRTEELAKKLRAAERVSDQYNLVALGGLCKRVLGEPDQICMQFYSEGAQQEVRNSELALWDAQDAFDKEPTRDNGRALELAELQLESSEGILIARRGAQIGNPLLSALGWHKGAVADDIWYRITEEKLEDEYWDAIDSGAYGTPPPRRRGREDGWGPQRGYINW